MIGLVLNNPKTGLWVIVDEPDDKKIVILNRGLACFLINRTHAEHSGWEKIEGVINWNSAVITSKGTRAFWAQPYEVKEEYKQYLEYISTAEEKIKEYERLEAERREREREEEKNRQILAQAAKESAKLLEKEQIVNYEHHVPIPNMWYCYVYGKNGAITGGRYFNPQYVREITPLAKVNCYKLKLAGYHQQDYNEDKWGFTYVNVYTEFR